MLECNLFTIHMPRRDRISSRFPEPSQPLYGPLYHYVLDQISVDEQPSRESKRRMTSRKERKEPTQTKSMRQPFLTNKHLRPRPIPQRNYLIPRLLRNPMVIPAEVEEHLRKRFACHRHAPDIVGPLVCGYCSHLVRGHVTTFVLVSGGWE